MIGSIVRGSSMRPGMFGLTCHNSLVQTPQNILWGFTLTAQEWDLYPIIVQNDIRNTDDNPWAAEQLIAWTKSHASLAVQQLAFKLRHKLSALIDEVWSWETVADTLALVGQSRWDRFLQVAREPCLCSGAWRQWAEWSLQSNGLDATALCQHVAGCIQAGRDESVPLVVCVGRFGGEGKSFFLAPLRNIYGPDFVQDAPQPGNFPLLGLEKKRVVILDEWAFGSDIIPFSTQLMWFEGKAFPITRPQNKDFSGHCRYAGKAPIFITCKESDIAPIVGRAHAAMTAGMPSQDSMMIRRLRLYHFTVQLPIPKGQHVYECGSCFARLVLQRCA